MSGEIYKGREHSGDWDLVAEVCVVGSGAGGAVIAKNLSEAGLDVIVLEEGGHTPPEVYGKYRPTETLRHMAREAGTTATFSLGDTPLIGIMAGRCVGGSSIMTGGVCFRLPESVTDTWSRELGLHGFSQKDLEDCYHEVEREVHVETVPENMRSRSTALFAKGAAAHGISMKSLRRNTLNCNGCGRCTFGCPEKAKLSVDLTYLKKAVAAGTRIYADCRADRILSEHGRASGVEGRILEGPNGKAKGRFRVRAQTVVVCAGTLHTPVLLGQSGVGKRSKQLGKRITLHPAFRVAAMFEQEVRGWQGAMQSTYSDHFEHDGITLVSVFTTMNVIAAAMTGVGPEHHEMLKQMGKLAMFGGMIHDDGGGTIHRGFGREPIVTYRMSPRDRVRMFQAMRIMAEVFLTSGAKQVHLPLFGSTPVRNPDDLKFLTEPGVPARMVECITFHPLGSARMGVDAQRGVVSPTGESFELPGLYVSDGSLFPTSIGVNSQLPIMTMATRIARGLREKLTSHRIRPNVGVVAAESVAQVAAQ